MKQVEIEWEPAAERFVARGADDKHVVVNAPHADEATPRTGISPAELLLVAAGTCSAWDVVEILRKQRQDVEGVSIHVAGAQEPEAPWTFREVVLEFRVTGRGLDHDKVERAVRLSEERYCSVTSTIRHGALVRSVVHVEEPEEAAVGSGVPAPAASGSGVEESGGAAPGAQSLT